jgi:asparagine synthase (glutamine-hydrolysing)
MLSCSESANGPFSMCGIVAVFSYKSGGAPVNGDEIQRIRDQMVRRGPDGAGLWISEDRTVGLAHRRLAIIDLSPKGAQPMALAASGVRVTFNGEIYNYRDLRRDLEQRGRIFVSDSDTEVLLHAYEVFGPAMVEHLRGMYAFAIWDPLRRGLFLARDPFGIKPLYYADDGERIVVASQVQALLQADGVAMDHDPAAKVSFLLMGNIVEPLTLFRSIRALPAGTTLWIDGRGVCPPACFWSVTDIFRTAEEQAVADVPVGIFLSGGLDSTTLLALATEAGFNGLQTTTLGFDALRGSPYDEVALAERVASVFQTHHQSRWINAETFAEDRDALFAAMDQPSVDGINVFFVSKVAAAAGVKVALSGLGGDEVFGGYPSFRQIPQLAGMLSPFARAPWFGRTFRRLSAPVLKHMTSPKYASLFEFGSTVEDAYLLRRGLFLPWEVADILDPDEARQGWADLALLTRLRDGTQGLHQPRLKVAALEMAFYMRNQLLRDSDWAGMAHSLEIRLPFVDSHLLQKLAPLLVGPNPPGKRDMAGAPSQALPSEILQRPKSGFSVPVRQWLMKDLSPAAASAERGLRGWAKLVLEKHLGPRM